MGAGSQRGFVSALDIASTLKPVSAQAREISLQAMNAKTIAARAGQSARAIQPIADYVDELSRQVIRLVQQVEAESIRVTRLALDAFAETRVQAQFARAARLGRGARHIASIAPAAAHAEAQLARAAADLAAHEKSMALVLDEIRTAMMAMQIATSKFRLEVGAGAEANRAGFEALIEKLEDAVGQIRRAVDASARLLR
ncbi:MAG: hypothetical protein RIM80_12425 [Alphaproteobacteria bacterium]